MYYHSFQSPALIKTGENILGAIDSLLLSCHLSFPRKILVTQSNLWDEYHEILNQNHFDEVLLVQGGKVDEAPQVMESIKNKDALVLAFGGGSVLDIVKYCASNTDTPYITVPSTLSNDAVYSCVARLTCDGKKRSYGVQPPLGIIVDFGVIRQSPHALLCAGVADIVSNLSALKDWKLAYHNIGEPINELAYMLSKESVMPLLQYHNREDLYTDAFLYDLTNAIVTSGLSMIVAGNTRVSSGAEHLISHAIDEYFPEKSTIHGLQVGWAHLMVEKCIRKDLNAYTQLHSFYKNLGVLEEIENNVPWKEEDLQILIPYALKIRNRYTIFNEYVKGQNNK